MRTTAVHLRSEHLSESLAVADPRPRLSWRLATDRRGARQTAFRLQAAAAAADLEAGRSSLWDSGRVAGDQTTDVRWGGSPLAAFARALWRVKVWDETGSESEWSEPAIVARGPEQTADWAPARWITSPLHFTPAVPLLRRAFTTARPAVEARVYLTARGVCDLWLDGEEASDTVLAPGYHDYGRRQLFRCHDVTRLLRQPGEHVLAAMLGDGWYRGPIAWAPGNRYGHMPSLLCLLRIVHDDGSVTVVGSDSLWRTANGPILASGLLAGEVCDLGLEPVGWNRPGFAAEAWMPVRTSDLDAVPLLPHRGPPVRRIASFAPRRSWQPRPGAWMVDFGQNLAGRVRLDLDGVRPGTVVRIRHGEMSTPDGGLYVDNLRGALASDTCVVGANGPASWEPRFTFHGFQFAEVTGLEREPRLTAVALASDCGEAGGFACSDPRLDQLWSNIVWTQRANWLDIPTDCPQRDERMGWTGDAQAFIRTAACTHDVQAFFAKWHDDLRDAQSEAGAFPNIAPNPRDLLGGAMALGDAAWGDAGVICPWTMWQVYGDREQVREMFPAMLRWCDYLAATALPSADTRWSTKALHVWGDWLSIAEQTAAEVVMTAFYARSVDLTAQAARLLGASADADRLEARLARIKAAFLRDFFRDGRVMGRSVDAESQTGYCLALHFDLLPEAIRPAAVERLVALIAAKDWHLATGFVGLPYLLPVLSRFGRSDVAFRLLTTESYPSWLYSVAQGATTVWERWNGWLKDSGPADPGMNSYAHYAYGAVGEWMMTDVVGIDAVAPGFTRIRIRPRLGGGLSWAAGWQDCAHGRIASRWEADAERAVFTITIPPNTTAEVAIPTSDPGSVRSDGPGAVRPGAEGYVCCELPAGSWRLEAAR